MANPCIVMVGTSPATRGGISAVVNTYRDCGLFDRWPTVYVCSHVDGGYRQKASVALRAIVRFTALAARGASVAHVHSSSNASFWRKSVFVMIARLLRVPVLFHLHGGGFIDFYRNESGPIGRWAIRMVLRSASCIVVLSAYWKTQLEAIVPGARVVPIRNPVSASACATAPVSRRAGQIVFLGKVCAEKGIDDLLAAFRSLVASCPHARLEIGGDGELDALRSRISEYRLEASVHVHGWISGATKARLLAESSIFVLPSHAEGMPMAILEAMLHGLAIVATRVGAVPEVVEHDVAGLLTEPGRIDQLVAALRTLVVDEARCRDMGARAQQKACAEFAPAVVVPMIENIYRELALTNITCPADTAIGTPTDDSR